MGSEFPPSTLQPSDPQAQQPAHQEQEARQAHPPSPALTQSPNHSFRGAEPFSLTLKRQASPCKASFHFSHPVHDTAPTAGPSVSRDSPTAQRGPRYPQPRIATACPSSEGPQLTSPASEAAQIRGSPSSSQPELGALLRGLCDVCSSPP